MNVDKQQSLKRLISVMQKLRDPENGCPWDKEQTWKSLIEHTLEEAYEVADAIENSSGENAADSVKEELGDLLFQVVFYAQIADEQNQFDLHQVIHTLCDKLEARHPHVFSNANYTRADLDQAWHETKKKERNAKKQISVLDDIPLSFPALTRAQKIQNRASKEGFDWRSIEPVFDKLEEEISELKQAMIENDQSHIQDEMGDVLFTVVNLARHLKLDSETSLRLSSLKFEKRYRKVEDIVKQQDRLISDNTTEELLAIWDSIKHQI